MKNIPRNNDVIYNENDLEHLYTFKNFPVFMGCTEQNVCDDVTSDMSWHISKGSGMIQLNPLLPLDVVYQVSHGSGTTGKLWTEHHESFARFIAKFQPKRVLEVGGGHGTLAKTFLKTQQDTFWTIVEPNPTVEETASLKVLKDFFDEKFKYTEKIDALIHSHVFEHVYDPNLFLSHISSFTQEGGLLLFSVPNMEYMLKNNYTNCINFEHTIFLTEPYIEHILLKHKFEIVSKEYFKVDHSIFYCAKKVDRSLDCSLNNNLYAINKAYFNNYIQSHLQDVAQLNDLISKTDKPVFLFGAHIFSQYLLSFGLNTNKIVCLLDNDRKKQGKRLYGTALQSNTPAVLKGLGEVFVILRAGVYNEEIRQDILNNINPHVVFI
jgi:predicted SAM-dependent methyltransferase